MADKLKANGAAGVVMFNRFYEPDINLDKLELVASEVFSSPSICVVRCAGWVLFHLRLRIWILLPQPESTMAMR